MFNSISMTRLAASVAKAMDAEAPKQAEAPIPFVEDLVKNALGGQGGPGHDLQPRLHPHVAIPEIYGEVCARPGGYPADGACGHCHALRDPRVLRHHVHRRHARCPRIRSYTKPVITIDSLFDSLRRSGKRVALSAVAESSMALIFQNRDIDYFLTPYDGEATEKGLELIAGGNYDVVVVYNQEYDDMIHDTVPESPQAMAAVDHHIEGVYPPHRWPYGSTGLTATAWWSGPRTTATTSDWGRPRQPRGIPPGGHQCDALLRRLSQAVRAGAGQRPAADTAEEVRRRDASRA